MVQVIARDSLSHDRLYVIHMVSYGVSLVTALEHGGAVGARFDGDYEGEVDGERLSGTSIGTFYIFLTGGPSVMTRRFGEILTTDHSSIAVTAEGFGRYYPADEVIRFTESATFFAASSEYRWLSGPARVTSGTLSIPAGTIEVSTKTAKGAVVHAVGAV